MWRLGTLLVLSVVFRCSSSAGQESYERTERFKRSPHYPCPPYFFDPRPYPPPPPPPFWPPPPPPPPPTYYQERQNYENELQPQNLQNSQSQAYKEAESQPSPQTNQGNIEFPDNKPCDKCDKGQSTAISNAKSESGTAIAVAIAGKGNNR